jgi:hypothetical protein
VDRSRRGVEILEEHREESVSLYEVLDEVHAQRIALESASAQGSDG